MWLCCACDLGADLVTGWLYYCRVDLGERQRHCTGEGGHRPHTPLRVLLVLANEAVRLGAYWCLLDWCLLD